MYNMLESGLPDRLDSQLPGFLHRTLTLRRN